MATRTSNASGDWATAGTWVGGIPGAGDLAIIASGHNVHVSTAVTVGQKSSGIGIGCNVQAGGTLTLDATGVLTVRGFDTTTNNALTVDASGTITSAAGGTVLFDCPSDWGTTLKCNGNFNPVGAIFDIPTGNITWSNTSGSVVVSSLSAYPYDFAHGIYSYKLLNTGGDLDAGPVSNSGGTGIGSFGDSSFAKSSGGFDGTTFNAVSSYAGIVSNGDFYLDHAKGVVYYKSSSHVLTITYSWKFATWFSYGIVCTNNASNSAVSITGGTQINHAGVNATLQNSESTQGGLMIDDKFAPGLGDGTRNLVINGLVFNYCTRALQYYQSDITGSDATHHQVITNVTFNNCRYNGTGGSTYSFSSGLINHGWGSYTDYTNLIFNSCCPLFTSLSRGPGTNITVSGCTGSALDGTAHLIVGQLTPHNGSPYSDCSFSNNGTSTTAPLTGFGGNFDTCAFQEPGLSGHPNVYSNNYLRGVHRVARLASYMTVSNNYWDRTYHHGIVHQSGDGYISNYICTNNIGVNNYDSTLGSTDPCGGGWTGGYNRAQWIDNVVIKNNTFDSSNRSIQFSDDENSIALITRCSIINNILSSNDQGIRNDASGSTNFSSIALTQLDYNDDYANTANVSNILQGTFVFGGVNYNSSGSKTAAGCYLFNPSYTLPAAALNLVLTVAGAYGVAGTGTKSVKVAWGGGAQVEFIAFQGVLTSSSNPAGGPAVLNDILAAFTTTGTGLKGFQVVIATGTGAGQYGMVKSNTSTQLTVIPNTNSGNWAVTPDATSDYLVIKPHQTITDSGTGTISCGIYSPELVLTNNTYSDSTISITKGYPGTSGANNGVNPNFVSSSDFRPQNIALKGTGSDGADIGALSGLWPTPSTPAKGATNSINYINRVNYL